MCGRVWQTLTQAEIRRLFDVPAPIDVPPRYNLAPPSRCGGSFSTTSEWRCRPAGACSPVKKARQPVALRLRDERPLVCAGLWNELDGAFSCTVLTAGPVGVFGTLHDRMPLLPQDRWVSWLDPRTDPDTVWSLATEPHALHTAVHAYPVRLAVGNVHNDSIELTYPLD